MDLEIIQDLSVVSYLFDKSASYKIKREKINNYPSKLTVSKLYEI